jgi:hypothetical protein
LDDLTAKIIDNFLPAFSICITVGVNAASDNLKPHGAHQTTGSFHENQSVFRLCPDSRASKSLILVSAFLRPKPLAVF